MAAAIQVAPHENDMIVQMRGYAQRMVRAVATTGSGAATPDVLAFQQAWNRNLPIIKALLQKLGQPTTAAKVLVEDGQYGPNTSNALCGIICGPGLTSKPPARASGMPVWATQNSDYIAGLTPSATAPADSVLNQPMPIPADGGAAEAERALQSGGSTVRDIIPVSQGDSAPVPPPPEIVSTTSSYIPTVAPGTGDVLNAPGPQTPIPQLTEQELAALDVDTGFEGEPITIVGTRPRSRVPWIAAGVGAAALGGVMYWWVNRKKRRR